jgi:hypothetical protein
MAWIAGLSIRELFVLDNSPIRKIRVLRYCEEDVCRCAGFGRCDFLELTGVVLSDCALLLSTPVLLRGRNNFTSHRADGTMYTQLSAALGCKAVDLVLGSKGFSSSSHG